MTTCKFFLQGRCRFGDRCFNKHSYSDRYVTSRQVQDCDKTNDQNMSAAAHLTQSAANSSTTNISKTAQLVKEDILAWENGNMWPFSSYSLPKDVGGHIHFWDISPEELRNEAYRAAKNDELPKHEKQVSDALAVVRQKWSDLLKTCTVQKEKETSEHSRVDPVAYKWASQRGSVATPRNGYPQQTQKDPAFSMDVD